MHHSQVPSTLQVSCKCVDLAFWRVCPCPEPVFDVHAPVDDVWVGDDFCEMLA